MKISIVLKKSKADAAGLCPLYLRISVNGKRREIYTGDKILPKNWDSKNQKVTNDDSLTARLHFDLAKFSRIKNRLLVNNQIESAEKIKKMMLGVKVEKLSVPRITRYIKDHLETNNKYAYPTRKVYSQCRKLIELFDARRNLDEVDGNWMKDFDSWLRSERGHRDSTVYKTVKCVKAVLRKAKADGVISSFNIMNYKVRRGGGDVKYFNTGELKTLMAYDPRGKTDKKIKRAFLWSCFAGGMRFGDVLTLTYDKIHKEYDGETWEYILRYNMRKTGNKIDIQLNKNALDQIDINKIGTQELVFGLIKQTDLDLQEDDLSYRLEKRNAYVNKRLKEIMKSAGLKRQLSFHKSRATHICIGLEKGIDVMTLTSLAGLKDVRVLQKHYAEAIDKKKKEAMAKFDDI